MALPNVVVLPGFEGSNLDGKLPLLPPIRYWVTFPPLLGARFGFLELKQDGLTPAFNFAGTITPAGIVPFVYDGLIRFLQQQWNVIPMAYDFRKSIVVTGREVWTKIHEMIPGQDYYVVAHSLGGLVARFLWREEVAAGLQSQFKRLVTLGTPHWGTYNAVKAFNRQSESYRLLVIGTLGSAMPLLERAVDALSGRPFAFLDRVLGSWPAIYEQFPNPQNPFVTGDIPRSILFTPSLWEPINVGVTAPRLTSGRATVALLNDPSTFPPAEKIVCFSGRGIATPSLFNRGQSITSRNAFFHTDGDGTVARVDASLRGPSVDVWTDHIDLVRNPLVLGNLTRLLLNGLPPPPAGEEHPGQFTIPGPAGPAGELSTFPPEFFSTIDLMGGSPRASAGDEPRPAYCP